MITAAIMTPKLYIISPTIWTIAALMLIFSSSDLTDCTSTTLILFELCARSSLISSMEGALFCVVGVLSVLLDASIEAPMLATTLAGLSSSTYSTLWLNIRFPVCSFCLIKVEFVFSAVVGSAFIFKGA